MASKDADGEVVEIHVYHTFHDLHQMEENHVDVLMVPDLYYVLVEWVILVCKD